MATCRSAAHGAFGLLNSTPHSIVGVTPFGDSDSAAALLRRMALAALTDPGLGVAG